MYWLLLFCFGLSAHPFDRVKPSPPEEIASLQGDWLIEGCISPLSGQVVMWEKDLGIEGNFLEKRYIAPEILGRYSQHDRIDELLVSLNMQEQESCGWVVHPALWAGYNQNSPYFLLRDPRGFVLEFEIKDSIGILKTPHFGCSNLSGEEVVGENDVRNISIYREGEFICALWPNQVKRIYEKEGRDLYRLQKEVFSDGRVLHYQYEGEELFRIETNSGGVFQKKEKGWKTSIGEEVFHTFEKKEKKGIFRENGEKIRVKAEFSLMTADHWSYDERFLLNSYQGMSFVYSRDWQRVRVTELIKDHEKISIRYCSPVAGSLDGYTEVMYASGKKVVYYFNQNLLLEAIEVWQGNLLEDWKKFSYDERFHIQKMETKEMTRIFECDENGYPVLENLSGSFGNVNLRREYDKGRLVWVERDDGLQVKFSYQEEGTVPVLREVFDSGRRLACDGVDIDFYSFLKPPKNEGVYDVVGRLIEKKDGSVVTRFIYDGAKVVEEIDAEGYSTKYHYDSLNRISQIERAGRVARYHYDTEKILEKRDGLQREKGDFLKPIPMLQKELSYDALGRVIGGEGFSRKLDAFGNVLREEWVNGLWVETDYNDWDLPTERRFSDGSKLVYRYHLFELCEIERWRNGEFLYSFPVQKACIPEFCAEESDPPVGFVCDEKGRIVEARGERYRYDGMNRRIQKGAVSFLYIGTEEIGAFERGHAKEFKIGTEMVEIDGIAFATVSEMGITRALLDRETGKIVKTNECSAEGQGLSEAIPYAYRGGRFDARTGLVCFGDRYYCPKTKGWLRRK